MKRRLYRILCATGIFCVAGTFFLMLVFSYRMVIGMEIADLKGRCGLLETALSHTSQRDQLLREAAERRTDGKAMRVTYLNSSGEVQFDTGEEAGRLESHAERPEIRQAIREGEGGAMRYSGTAGINMLYQARRLQNGDVLRVAYPVDTSVGMILTKALPWTAVLILAVLVLCTHIATHLTRRFLAPVMKATEDLEHIRGEEVYDELIPFIVKIRAQKDEIAAQIRRLEQERDTIKAITGNMREGVVLLDLEQRVLSANRSAVSLLGGRGDYAGQKLAALSREPELLRLGKKACEGEKGGLLLKTGNGYLNILASPVFLSGRPGGAALLVVDVTEQQNQENMRRDFTANVTHELKTPLTSISGYAELIMTGMAREDEDIRQFARRIYEQVKRLVVLIDDILLLSSLDAKAERQLETVDLRPICQEVLRDLSFAAGERHVRLEYKGGSVCAPVNITMFYELLYNLVSNAVRYNRPDGSVTVRLREKGPHVAVCVEDTGIGIGREHLARVFERFYRVDKSRSRETGGTGLGLSIVRHIAELHGGSVSIQSEEGAGTVAEVLLPRAGCEFVECTGIIAEN